MRFVLLRRRFGVPWLPLSLHWRRRRKAPPAVRASRASTAATARPIPWLSHIHLHFTTLANDRRRRDEMPALSPATVTRELQRVLERRHSTTLRPAAWTTRVVHHATRVFRTISNTRIHIAHAAAGSPPPQPARTVHRIVERRVHPLVESRRKIIRSHASSHERTLRIERLVSRELRVFRGMAAPLRAARIAREEPANAPLAVVRPPALVWRRAAQVPGGDATFEAPRASTQVPLMRSSAAIQDPEPPRRATRAALQAADIDSSLLDRLTDDVIRRVERRVRIERERRGL